MNSPRIAAACVAVAAPSLAFADGGSQRTDLSGLFAVLAVIGIVGGIFFWAHQANEKARQEKEQARIRAAAVERDRIRTKYGSGEIAERILSKTVWVGETAEQLRDSLGAPLDIDQKVLKTKRKEIWKYDRKGANRYGLKFTVENGVVVGWDEKQ